MSTAQLLPPVERRDLHFDLSDIDMCRWHPAGTHVSMLLNTLSLLFPDGERFFIQSVRYYQDRIEDPQLGAQVKGFIGQEAMHGREHQVYNDALAQAGMPAHEIQASVLDQLKGAHKILSRRAQLALTIAMEHFTAILADALLTDDRIVGGAPPKMAALWRWHAIEETEHKAVAYDVYQATSRGLWGYFVRCVMMLLISIYFLVESFMYHRRMVRSVGLQADREGRRNYYRFLFTSPGVLVKVFPAWLRYFKPGFHPWQHDNRQHVERWKAAYATEGRPPAD